MKKVESLYITQEDIIAKSKVYAGPKEDAPHQIECFGRITMGGMDGAEAIGMYPSYDLVYTEVLEFLGSPEVKGWAREGRVLGFSLSKRTTAEEKARLMEVSGAEWDDILLDYGSETHAMRF